MENLNEKEDPAFNKRYTAELLKKSAALRKKYKAVQQKFTALKKKTEEFLKR